MANYNQPRAFIIYTPGFFQSDCDHLKNARLYIRANNFTFDNIANFNQNFQTTPQSEKKTIQQRSLAKKP